ncbi:MAG TPA: M15 family metallopeptidase [Actinomycetota bacterium]|nr:M15 family metallopeptidase [Actinomycetota bacterium]
MSAAAALACVLTLAAVTPARATEPFEGSVSRLDAATRQLMRGNSWHAGCPIPLDRLRLVRITYVAFDATVRHGRLVLNRRWADDLLEVFRRLYDRGFPIRRVRLVDRYDADDRESMRHDNTSAFNCRTVAGTDVWSQHAYGRAIDIDPVENPYVDGTRVSPRKGREYLDRSDLRPGMIAKRDVVWRAFHRIGWEWGGTWRSAQDYQHFSSNGR